MYVAHRQIEKRKVLYLSYPPIDYIEIKTLIAAHSLVEWLS